MFSINSALNRFAILLCCSDDARTFRIVAYLIEKGASVIKLTTLSKEKKVLGQNFKKVGFFGVVTHYCTKSLLNFTVVLR